jgi:hypothetical protein
MCSHNVKGQKGTWSAFIGVWGVECAFAFDPFGRWRAKSVVGLCRGKLFEDLFTCGVVHIISV